MEVFWMDLAVLVVAFVVVPGFLLFIACLYVEACDAMDKMEREHKGKRE